MFKTFPEFSKLTLADRDEYEALIKDFPPISDIAFASMMIWWSSLGGLAVSLLNDNLVISYWLPGDENRSGLSLIGVRNVDQSICTIFDYLSESGEKPRLVNVPEFVVYSMRYPELFNFRTGTGDDEYLMSLAKFARLEDMPVYMRIRVRKFLRAVGQSNIEIKKLDLKSLRTQQLLLKVEEGWPLKGVNNINKLERSVLPVAVLHGRELGVQGVGLYIEGELQAYCLYFPTNDSDHTIISHARVNYDIPRIFDYTVYAFSNYLSDQGFKYINLHSDNGSQKMRALKLALKPENFFRKYTIEPSAKAGPVFNN